MSNYSQNIGLELPTEPEHYSIGVFNKNAMVIDSELHKLDLKNQSQDELLATKEVLNSEIKRASTKENSIVTDLTSEIERAKSAENTNAINLSNEITRATMAEEAMSQIIKIKADQTELDKYLPLTGGTVTSSDDISVIKLFSNFLVQGTRYIGGLLLGANNKELVRIQSEEVGGQVNFWIQDRILNKDIFKISSKERKIYDNGVLKKILVQGDASGSIELPRINDGDANYKPGKDIFEVKEFSSSSSNIPTANWYHIITMQGNDVREEYVTQLAVGMTVDALYYRRFHADTWEPWRKILLEGDTINNSIVYSDSQPTSLTSGMTWIGN